MKKYSFLDVFGTKILLENNQEIIIKEIEIPRIQRDYAQGRLKDIKKKTMDDKGKRFIEYIFNCLKEKRNVELDFVYGEINSGKLIPLDGQQRLTTLFLLHWYLGTFELNKEDLQLLKNKIINFSYETRDSSRTFCKKLVTTLGEKDLLRNRFSEYISNIDNRCKVLQEEYSSLKKEAGELENNISQIKNDNLIIKKRDLIYKEHECNSYLKNSTELKKISSFLKNESWYFNSYDNDPTIIAMLNMLDKIESLYSEHQDEYYTNLSNLKFSILPLEHVYQPEELYIKMNARGKQLTNFENFKADLIGWMIDIKNPEADLFNPKDKKNFVEYGPRKARMAYYQRFSNMIDNEWTVFLWSITKDYDPDERDKQNNLKYPFGKLVDPLFLSLFYRYFLFIKIENSNFDNNREVDKNPFFIELYSEKEYVKFDDIASLLNFKQIQRFERILNQLEKNSNKIFKSANPGWLQSSNNSAKKLFEVDISFTERVALYAVFKYLEKYNYDDVLFERWMRVVWNIAQNTDLDNWYGTIACLGVVNELVEHAEEIYKYLSFNNSSYKTELKSSQDAIEEERQKATLIDSDFNWEIYLKVAESHSYFKGSIKFLLSDGLSLEKFQQRFETSQLLFKSTGIKDEYRKEHDVLRYIISQLSSWKEVTTMKLIDIDERDQQHYLKQMLKKDYLIKPIQKLLDCNGIDQINSCIENGLINNSKIEDEYKNIHEILYKNPCIEKWMQNENEPNYRRLTIKKSEGRWFACKDGAWRDNYKDWLLLDTYRNKIIHYLLTSKSMKIDKETDMKVGDSFYCGYVIDIKQTGVSNSDGFLYRFKPNGLLLVNQMINNNINKEKALKYNYVNEIKTEADIPVLFDRIETDLLNKKNTETEDNK